VENGEWVMGKGERLKGIGDREGAPQFSILHSPGQHSFVTRHSPFSILLGSIHSSFVTRHSPFATSPSPLTPSLSAAQ